MQTTVSGKQGNLPELPCSVHLESGISGKRRLSAGDDRADFSNYFRLAIFLFRNIFQIRCSVFSADVFRAECLFLFLLFDHEIRLVHI